MKEKLLAAFAAAVSYVKSNIKPLWKGALKMAVQEGGDALQAELDKMIAEQGARAVPALIAKVDALEQRFAGLVRKVPCLPSGMADKAVAAVQDAVNSLDDRLRAAIEAETVGAMQGAFDAAFDRFQEELKGRIAEL